MAIQGFGVGNNSNEKYEGITLEDYAHKIKFLGLPLITITKKHTVDTKSIGKPQNQ
jgi:hypothetical protein